uniref:Uncharacterized protein n=1 Tax=Graphocephala atropunctata TaxID=36148 RepID=A0A1B6KFS0_9HEMI
MKKQEREWRYLMSHDCRYVSFDDVTPLPCLSILIWSFVRLVASKSALKKIKQYLNRSNLYFHTRTLTGSQTKFTVVLQNEESDLIIITTEHGLLKENLQNPYLSTLIGSFTKPRQRGSSRISKKDMEYHVKL